VLAVHGVTANHRCWAFVADRLPEFRILAPDLRGRGESSSVGAPFGMQTHADDMARVLDSFDVDRATLLGHSMGGFVSLVTADRHGHRVDSVVLVDGGLPLASPTEDELAQVRRAVVQPIADRLKVTFPDVASAVDAWRQHPAFADEWNDVIADYAAYDLGGEPPRLRSRVATEAVDADTGDLLQGDALIGALERLAHPVQWLLAPRGIQNETPPLYPAEAVQRWRQRFPQLDVHLIDDVNHYTIVISDRGAEGVTAAVRRALGASG
jgi:pimeloyl-ACP methyl ester carboxylesterase